MNGVAPDPAWMYCPQCYGVGMTSRTGFFGRADFPCASCAGRGLIPRPGHDTQHSAA